MVIYLKEKINIEGNILTNIKGNILMNIKGNIYDEY